MGCNQSKLRCIEFDDNIHHVRERGPTHHELKEVTNMLTKNMESSRFFERRHKGGYALAAVILMI